MSLIAWYKLDGNALDSSGNGRDGATVGTPNIGVGKIASAYSFDYGSDDGISIPNNKFPLYDFTMTAWIKPVGNHYHYDGTIISSGNWNGSHWSFGVNQSNTGFSCRNPYASGAYAFTLNTWHFVVYRREGTNLKLYANNTLVYNSTVTTHIPLSSDATNTCIGRETYAGGYFGFNGSIDDVRIYDHALSEKEIKELAKAKVLHYTFDEFQEPTYNWFYKQNPRVDSSYTPYIATTSGTWQAKHSNAIRVYNDEGSEITGYINSGVTDWTNTYHAIWEYDYGLRMPVVVQNDVDGNWKAKSWGLGQTMSSMGLSAGMKYTISWLQWTNNTSKRLRVGLYGKNSSDSDGFHDGQLYPANTMPYTWERVSATFTVSSIWNFSASLTCYMYGHYDTRAIIKIADVQMEIKDHNTEFTKSPSRGGSVSDNSGYNNHADLALATTPQWTSDSRIGKGAYKFNKGLEKRIQIPDPFLYDKTVSLWVKVKSGSHTAAERVVLMCYNDGTVTGSGDTNQILLCMENERFRMHGWNSADAICTTNINDGNWHHLVWQMKYHATDTTQRLMNMWTDGVQQVTNFNYNEGGDFPPMANRYWWIGYNSRSYSPYTRDADILVDDVRFYATLLSNNDVKELYNTRAQIDNKGNVYSNQINESTNLLDPYIFMSYSNNSKDPDIRFVDNRLTWRVYPSWFHPNGAMNGMFKANTQYRMRLTISHATIYDSVYRPGGLTIKHTDGTTISVVTTGDVNKTWQTAEAVSTTGKTIEGIYVYYYTSYEVRIDMNNSFLVEEQNYGIGNDGVWKETIFSELGPTNGLVAYYPLNGDAKDYANANDGTVNGAIISAGINGKACYSFDGVDDKILIFPNDVSLTNYTATGWFYRTDVTGSYGTILGNVSGGSAFELESIVSGGGAANLRAYPSTVLNTTYSLNQWHFFTLIRTLSAQSLYLDGALIGTEAPNARTVINTLQIGSWNGSQFFKGKIQNVRIYNRALSPEEISILYDLEKGDTIKVKMDKNTLYVDGEVNEAL